METASGRALRISTAGVRGEVGDGGLTAAHAIDFSLAFGSLLPEGAVVIGRDPRRSSRMIRHGIIAGLNATGHDVIDLGLVSTPVIQSAIRRLNAAGGISVGASHNAAPWNALKFLAQQGTYLSTAQAAELLDIYHANRFDYQPHSQLGKHSLQEDAIDHYLDELATVFEFAPLRRFRVIVDCCNGTSSLILRRMNDRFGFAFILINEQIAELGFAHEPVTSRRAVAMHLAPLIAPIAADAGFLFDVDSDRVAFATDEGASISSEMVLPLIADWQLPRGQGDLVITNLSTTALVDEVAARHGAKVVRAPVGRQAAIDTLAGFRDSDIALAGEGTGAVMLPQFRFAYDGIASMLATLSMMAERDQPLSKILAGYPRYSILKATVPLSSRHIPGLLMELEEDFSDGVANWMNGLRIDWPDRWFHVRVAQTEPVVRVICEAKGDPPTRLYQDLMERVARGPQRSAPR